MACEILGHPNEGEIHDYSQCGSKSVGVWQREWSRDSIHLAELFETKENALAIVRQILGLPVIDVKTPRSGPNKMDHRTIVLLDGKITMKVMDIRGRAKFRNAVYRFIGKLPARKFRFCMAQWKMGTSLKEHRVLWLAIVGVTAF